MERRSSILKLDSEAMKLARLIIKSSEEDITVLESIVEEHDKLTEAVLRMRENAEMIIGVSERVYDLKQSIEVANKVLRDRDHMRSNSTKSKSVDIDEGLHAEVAERLSDDVTP